MAVLPLEKRLNYTRRAIHLGSKNKTQKKQCLPGYIEKRGYVRKFDKNILEKGYTVKRADGIIYRIQPRIASVHVKASCIKNKNPPGKEYGFIRMGGFIKNGYIYTEPVEIRRKALKISIKEYGIQSVYNKLRTLSMMALRKLPEASKIFKQDSHWIENNYKIKY